jgi:hypothetical protein
MCGTRTHTSFWHTWRVERVLCFAHVVIVVMCELVAMLYSAPNVYVCHLFSASVRVCVCVVGVY